MGCVAGRACGNAILLHWREGLGGHGPLYSCLFLALPGNSSGAKNLPSELVRCVSHQPTRTELSAHSFCCCRQATLPRARARRRSSGGWGPQHCAQSPDALPWGPGSVIQGKASSSLGVMAVEIGALVRDVSLHTPSLGSCLLFSELPASTVH